MSTPMRLVLVLAVLCLAILVSQLMPGCEADGAPAPLDRSTRHKHLSRNDMVGEWEMTWAGQCWRTDLAADGTYGSGVYSGLTYRGTWSWRCGLLWISEYTNYNPECLRTYSVKIDPRTMSGAVEAGSPGTKVSFKRRVR